MGINGFDADLFDAVEFGDTEYAEFLLDGPGVDVDGTLIKINAQDLAGVTVLMLAASYGHMDLVRRIVNRGADLNLADRQGRTALKRAAEQGHYQVVAFLKEMGAEQ